LIGDIWSFIYYLPSEVGRFVDSQVLPLLPDWLGYVLYALVRMGVILGFVIVTVLVYIYLERRVVARFQVRLGPNRVGPFGLLQGFADVLKLLTKEIITPARGDRTLHTLAPIIAVIPSILALVVIPFAPGAVLADINVAVLFLFAISTAGTLAVLMAGWASNNKYALLGGMRMVAMTISYELPLILSVLGVVMITQSMSLGEIVRWQSANGWLALYQPVGMLLFFLGGLAELGRSPFDIIEGESEITAGYHAEYGGFQFAMLFLREYIDTIVISALVATLFLGGWDTSFLGWRPFGVDLFGFIPPYVILPLKSVFVFFFIMWFRATLPRVRIDQVMAFSWKFLLPVALVNIFLTAVLVLAIDSLFGTNPLPLLLLFLVNAVVTIIMIVIWQNRMVGKRWALQPMV
jgi:NADH-quinone oxidoreductase subunit H